MQNETVQLYFQQMSSNQGEEVGAQPQPAVNQGSSLPIPR